MVPPRKYKRSGATVSRYLATLSHALSFAVKERRLVDRNPVADILVSPNLACVLCGGWTGIPLALSANSVQ